MLQIFEKFLNGLPQPAEVNVENVLCDKQCEDNEPHELEDNAEDPELTQNLAHDHENHHQRGRPLSLCRPPIDTLQDIEHGQHIGEAHDKSSAQQGPQDAVSQADDHQGHKENQSFPNSQLLPEILDIRYQVVVFHA